MLSPARAKQVESLLVQIRLPVSKLVDTLISGDAANSLSHPHLTQLKVTVPTPGEAKLFQPYTTRAELRKLSKPDRYFGEISGLASFPELVSALLYKKSFGWDAEDTAAGFATLCEAAEACTGNPRLPALIEQLRSLVAEKGGATHSGHDVVIEAGSAASLVKRWCLGARRHCQALLRLPEELRQLHQAAGRSQAGLERRHEELGRGLFGVESLAGELQAAGKHQEAVATLRGFVETATGGMARLTEVRGRLPAAQGKLQRLLGDTGLSVEQGCEAISRLLDEVVAARIATGSPAPSEPGTPYQCS